MNLFREALNKKEFIYTLELVPGRGSRGKTQDEVLSLAERAARGKRIHTVTITDNPGGHPALFPNVIGREICQMGMNPMIHFTCKDKNRNQIESILYALDRLGIENLLAMTGDFPSYGFEGQAKPVYDLDSVHLLQLIRHLNEGRCIDERAPGGGLECPPTHFFRGCAVSPFKGWEAEVMAQYYKLGKKVRAGADFIITQVGFDARKFHELLLFLQQRGIRVPVLGNVYLLNRGVARVMNQGRVPGCVVTDRLYRLIDDESHAADRGRAARLTRGAKLIAVLRGMGYAGVHIGGPNLRYEDVEWVIEKSLEYDSGWQEWAREFFFPQEGGFYLYEKEGKTGLNAQVPPGERCAPSKSAGYALMRSLHRLAFIPEAPFFHVLRWFFQKVDGTWLERAATELEYWVKFMSSRCRRCGDCTLPEVAFLCPQSQCPKYLFNGQCGGARDGWCEVFPEHRRCIYVRAYARLRSYREEDSLGEGYIPPRNWALDQTSSWANYYLGRDHNAAGKTRMKDEG